MGSILIAQSSIATENNPTLLTKRLSDRPLLQEHMPSVDSADLAKYAKQTTYDNQHVINLLSTPTLTLDELKVALFLFERGINRDEWIDDEVISIKTNNNKDENIGDNGKIYFKNSPTSKIFFKYPIPKTNLLDLLTKHNITLENSGNILNILARLHNFGFLTLTLVNESSSINNIDYPSQQQQETKYVHIVLNFGVVSSKLSCKWGKPKKENKIKDKQTPAMNLASTALSATRKAKK
jgi:hypothetical protein